MSPRSVASRRLWSSQSRVYSAKSVALPLVLTAPVQVRRADGPLGEGARVPAARLLGDDVDADARHPGRGPGEVAIDEVEVEAHALEDLCAAVALQRRDPHLGHDLQ